jgi:predicted AAA+ superfamily ATPase
MFQRQILNTVLNDLTKVPAVVLYGPRQVGKTTMVKQLLAMNPEKFLMLDLELPSDRAKLADPELFLVRYEEKTVVLDEVQFVPELFPVLRALIDKNRKPGRFILLGSASPKLMQQSAESLAGRVRYRELFPLTPGEIEKSELERLWLRGGFPEAFVAEDDTEATKWHTDFIRSYSTRDLPLLGLPMAATQVERLLQMLAYSHGQLLNYSSLSKSLGISVPTVINAVQFLEEALLIRLLRPWSSNAGKRLVKTHKVYIRDTGMLHHLLGVSTFNQLMGHPQAGHSWEGFVVQQILAYLPAGLSPFFYRTAAGAELDLVLMQGEQAAYAFEIKLGTAPKLSRGNTESANDLNPAQKIVIYSNEDAYPLRDDWEVMGLSGFLEGCAFSK